MKYICLTFDDGRDDNYFVAYSILSEYKMPATIFCTTGYIDGSWSKKDDWHSANKPLLLEQLGELKKAGWELGLHGDKHVTEYDDACNALSKFDCWGFGSTNVGFSLPDSKVRQDLLKYFVDNLYPNKICYIRRGRAIDITKLRSKVLYGFYNYLGFQSAYNAFNKSNVITRDNVDLLNIPSLVVRFNDKPTMLTKFIEKCPDNSMLVLMLHSILPNSNPLYGKDPWNWEDKKFNELCKFLYEQQNNKFLKVVTLKDGLSMLEK